MAVILKPKKSTTASAVPTTAALADGEMAVNTADKKWYVRVGASVVDMSPSWDNITNKPTTLAGYGITDAPTKTGTGASGTWGISITGSAAKLTTARTINGTSFDGTANITTANWGTARTITIGNTGKSVNGSANVSWSLAEIGATNADGNYIVSDTRNVDTPTDLGERGVKYEFKSNATDGLNDGGTYHGVMTFQPWHDSTGGNTHQLGFTNNGNLWLRTAPIGGTWGPWRVVYHSGNLGAATESSAGIVELATVAEAKAGTDTTRAVTPAGAFGLLHRFGLGDAAAYVPGNNIDDNTIPTGFYYVNSTTSGTKPAGDDGYGHLIVSREGTGVTARQLYLDNTTNRIWARTWSPSQWSEWVEIYHSGNLNTANAGTATKLQTARTITIGNTGKSFDGSANVSWSLAEIGAAAATATVNLSGDQTIAGNKTFSTDKGLRAQGLILIRQDTYTEGGEISFQRASDAAIHYYLDVFGAGTTPSFRLVNASREATTWSVDDSGNMTAEGNVTAFSDIRLKTDLRPIPEALAKVKQLTGYTYTRIDTGERQTGLIAQDVQRVLPEAVIEGEHLSLAYGNLVGLLVEAIKEQARQIEALTARVEKLEAR